MSSQPRDDQHPPSLSPRVIEPAGEASATSSIPEVRRVPVVDIPDQMQIQPISSRIQSPSASTPALALSDQSDLALEVQRRTDAAMALLNKNSSNPHLPGHASPVPKRRVDTSQISGPRLDWASTSVETIPLTNVPGASPPASVSTATSTKLGSRFKKLRGTLRTKPLPTGEEVSPFTLQAPASAQSVTYDPAYLSPSGPAPPQSARSMESDRFKVSVTTPPASAGPALKGFMSRFRKNRPQDGADFDREREKVLYVHPTVHQSSSSATPADSSWQAEANESRVCSTPAENTMFPGGHGQDLSSASSTSDNSPPPASAPLTNLQLPFSQETRPQPDVGADRTTDDEAALKQLFDAASNLGLDQAALSDLLARSPSLSTKRSTAASKAFKHSSTTPSLTPSWVDPSRAASPQVGSTRATSPISTSGRPSLEQTVKMPLESFSQQLAEPAPVSRLSVRRQARKSTTTERSNIVRRTIIMPSDLRDIRLSVAQAPVPLPVPSSPPPPTRKGSTRRRRSASASSAHSSSVHDRAPTPPPPKSPDYSRFAADSPPVPQLPSILGSPLSAPSYLVAPPLEKSSSAYDSL
jgi:serine/arginine repetitive matrix protein 2